MTRKRSTTALEPSGDLKHDNMTKDLDANPQRESGMTPSKYGLVSHLET